VIDRKKIVRTSFVPVTRDDKNDVFLLDPSTGEGAKLVQAVKDRSTSRRPCASTARKSSCWKRPP
jgi:hypothetical protein